MIRARFHANEDDWRAVKFPPPGPCWCTGHGENYSTVVAYVETEAQILEYWPEATNIDSEPREVITFTDRFARPEWWPEGKVTLRADNVANLDPNYRSSRWRNFLSLWGWRVRMISYWMKEHRIPGDRIIFRIGVRM